jgi:hypothetical protein
VKVAVAIPKACEDKNSKTKTRQEENGKKFSRVLAFIKKHKYTMLEAVKVQPVPSKSAMLQTSKNSTSSAVHCSKFWRCS